MTPKEAVEHLDVYRRAITECCLRFLPKTADEYNAAIGMGIDAIEKAEKYRWHDLRENPEDLPEAETEVEIAYVAYNGAIYTARAFYEDGKVDSENSIMSGGDDGWESWDGIEYCEETDVYIIPECWLEYCTFGETYSIIDREVIAWREIEQFED